MVNRTLHRDVRRRTRERFRLWINDSVDLYGTAGLPYRTAAQDILEILIFGITRALVELEVEPQQAAAMIYDLMQQRREREERRQGHDGN